MIQEYCIIYTANRYNPSPQVFAVSDNQEYINGFREQFPYKCISGEIVTDSNFENYADYKIYEFGGFYLTPLITSAFCDYCRTIYNRLTMISDMIGRDLGYLKFNENDQDVIDHGFGMFEEILYDSAPIEFASDFDEIVNGCSIIDIPQCLIDFIETYEPIPF